MDVAIMLGKISVYYHLICSFLRLLYLFTRELSEKMALGALLLEGYNYDFWVVLGCLSDDNALKQHAFIRGLHLDLSLAVAWAYLGKVFFFMELVHLFSSMSHPFVIYFIAYSLSTYLYKGAGSSNMKT